MTNIQAEPDANAGKARPLPPILAYIMGAPTAPREAVERLIDAAITALDEMDGDPDLEPDDEDTAVDDVRHDGEKLQ